MEVVTDLGHAIRFCIRCLGGLEMGRWNDGEG